MKKLFKLTLLALVLGCVTYTANTQNLDPNKYYRLTCQFQGTGKSLDVIDDSLDNQLILAKTEEKPGQYWKFTPVGDGYYRLTSKLHGEGKSLDVINDAQDNKLILDNTGNNPGQYWKITPVNRGYYRLTCKFQGEDKSLDVINDVQDNKLILAKTGLFTGQYWRFTEIPEQETDETETTEEELVLPCKNSKTGAKATFVSNDGETIKLQMDWNEGSTLSGESLNITNGECINCPRLGGIGNPHPQEGIYEIKPTNLPEPVAIQWKSTKYCGNTTLTLPNYDLPCKNSKTGANATFLSNNGKVIELHMDWEEGATLDGRGLNITNGKCIDCPRLGGIGNPHPQEGIYRIEPTNLPEPVTIQWKSTQYCGDAALTLPNLDLPCENSKTGANATFVSNDGNTIRLHMDWDEGATLDGRGLVIENGKCVDCPRLGGMGRPHPVEGIYEIEPTNLPEPVTVQWKSTPYCSDAKMPLPNLDLPCTNSKTGAKMTYLSNEQGVIELHMAWEEGATLNGGGLKIINGKCIDCPSLGGIGNPHPKEGIYKVQQTDLNKPVTIQWTSRRYCGNGTLTVPKAKRQSMDK